MAGVGRHMLVIGAFTLLCIGVVALTYEAEPAAAQTLSPEEEAALRAEYDKLQEEIAQWQKVLDETKVKKNTLQGDVTLLNAQIKKAEAEIRQRNGSINRLAGEINKKIENINVLEARLQAGRTSLAQLIREKHEKESVPLAVMLLSAGNISDFFVNVDAINVINRDLQVHFDELRGVKQETEKEKEELNDKKNQELDARYEVEVKKEQVEDDEAEKERLLEITKQDEASYAQVLAERQRRAAEIYARLFPLRDSAAIQFGEAVEYAKVAGSKTGVRPVLVLAILSQESSIGANVGNCYVTNLETGTGVNKNTGQALQNIVMKAPRDTVPFERITKALGKDWSTTPVSCPQAQGYGGAMGPTQFIPSTWEMFEGRIKTALGVPATNPWNAQHAIMATGLYLMDAGGAAGGYSAERNAACRYFSGSACPNTGSYIDGYANSVVAKANAYAKDVEALEDL